MDEAEDSADNAFIANRIAQELRSPRLERRFVFTTHNANIPIFGDAEWIGVCSSGTQDRGELPIDRQGSIDIPGIRDQAAPFWRVARKRSCGARSHAGLIADDPPVQTA